MTLPILPRAGVLLLVAACSSAMRGDGADTGLGGSGGSGGTAWASGAACATVESWAAGCGMSDPQVMAEAQRCRDQEAALAEQCSEADLEQWAAALASLYDCYEAAAVCADRLDEPATADAAGTCAAAFEAAVASLMGTCLEDDGSSVGALDTCTPAEELGVHVPPTRLENRLGLGDESVARVPVPFDFSWYGRPLDALWVTSNGLLFAQETNETGCCEGRLIPQDDHVDGMVALAWTDLNPAAGGAVSWGLEGVPGDQSLTVSFIEVPTWTGDGRVTAAAVLSETSGTVAVHLGSVVSPSQPVTVGIESHDAVHGSCVSDLQASTGSWFERSYLVRPEEGP